MSVNGFVFNLVNDLKVTVNLGSGRRGRRPSVGEAIRGFMALGVLGCAALIVAGLTIAGATSGLESRPQVIETVYVGFIGAGLVPGLFLVPVYIIMSGGKRE